MAGFDPHAVIAHKKDRHALSPICYADFDDGLWLFAHEFRGVIDKVLKYFEDALTISIDAGQPILRARFHSAIMDAAVR